MKLEVANGGQQILINSLILHIICFPAFVTTKRPRSCALVSGTMDLGKAL